jgi:hypothetical protein
MTFSSLDASKYDHSVVFYNAEFEELLSKVIICYKLMLVDKVAVNNDENEIRDVLYLNYLNDNTVRNKIGLKDYYFDREVAEDRSQGRTDIRVLSNYSFEDTGAYYIIECKRLDAINSAGKTGLNAQYIQKGICRFASKKYSAYYKTNGMIGFIVEKIDIHANVSSINKLLKDPFKEANTAKSLFIRNIVSGFDYSYCSTHTVDSNEVIIYHLMFDFSKNIKP